MNPSRMTPPPELASAFDPASFLGTLSNANFTITSAGAAHGGSRSLRSRSTGKFYGEFTSINTVGEFALGIGTVATVNYSSSSGTAYGGVYRIVREDGFVLSNAAGIVGTAAWATGDIVGASMDFSTMTLSLYKNGAAIYSVVMPADTYYMFAKLWNGRAVTLATAQTYLPSGFQPW